MPVRFRLTIEDIFQFRDGQTVLVGEVDRGSKAIIITGPADVWIDDDKVATVNVYPVLTERTGHESDRNPLVSLATREETKLTRELVATRSCRIEGEARMAGHRHLIGIDSPPPKYVPDDMTQGPYLPEGWDGDAWIQPGGGGYFLRAWNKSQARYALGSGVKYGDARQQLLGEIARGGRGVQITVTELVSG